MTPKNWLFLGSKRRGEPTAIAFTLIENRKRYGLDLRSHLTSTIKKLIGSDPEATPKALTTHPKNGQ